MLRVQAAVFNDDDHWGQVLSRMDDPADYNDLVEIGTFLAEVTGGVYFFLNPREGALGVLCRGAGMHGKALGCSAYLMQGSGCAGCVDCRTIVIVPPH